MKQIVLKYPLTPKKIGEPFQILMPRGAEFLDAAYQPMAGLVSWFLCEDLTRERKLDENSFERRYFVLYFTGQDFDPFAHKYLATFSDKKGLIYHLFELVKVGGA